MALPSHPDGLADITTPKYSSSVRESMHKDRPSDVTFDQAAGPVVESLVGGEQEPDQFLKLDTQRDSGSERSFCSHKSFEKVSLSKTFQTQPGDLKSYSHSSRSNSHHSNGSLGNSLNYSYAHSDAFHSNGSAGGLSARSSLSDKAESVGSRNRGLGRLVTVGQSGSEGSEGSEGKAYPGKRTQEQIRSLAALGVQSDDESF